LRFIRTQESMGKIESDEAEQRLQRFRAAAKERA